MIPIIILFSFGVVGSGCFVSFLRDLEDPLDRLAYLEKTKYLKWLGSSENPLDIIDLKPEERLISPDTDLEPIEEIEEIEMESIEEKE